MATHSDDLERALMLDGNAVAGRLMEMFGAEMTTSHAECASCGQDHAMGQLLAFTLGPGIVLRCPGCEAVMIKLTQTPRGTYLDARGVALLRMPRR